MDPITLALIGGGTALSIFGTLQGAKAEAAAARQNALWLEEQASFIRESTLRELDIAERDQRLIIGEQYGAYAKAGVDLSGSALDTIRDTFSRASLELDAIQRNGEIQIREALLKARSERQYARDVIKAGNIKAIASLLSGSGDIYGRSGNL